MKLTQILESNQFFDYNRITNNFWQEELSKAFKEYNVLFDTENNERISEKVLTIDQTVWPDVNCKFKCQAWVAGGDWETPSIYFKCQLIEGYANIDNRELRTDDFFIHIPTGKANPHLEKTKGKLRPKDGDSSNEKYDEKEGWLELKAYLKACLDKSAKSAGS
jgi:hypothetical protein